MNINLEGIIIGIIAFMLIGIFHPIVIKGEYYFGAKIWSIFLIIGIILLVVSIFIKNAIVASSIAITGVSCLWSIGELKEQEERVEKGWFPRNPKRDK